MNGLCAKLGTYPQLGNNYFMPRYPYRKEAFGINREVFDHLYMSICWQEGH